MPLERVTHDRPVHPQLAAFEVWISQKEGISLHLRSEKLVHNSGPKRPPRQNPKPLGLHGKGVHHAPVVPEITADSDAVDDRRTQRDWTQDDVGWLVIPVASAGIGRAS
jgi:hypothetical protein